MPRRSLVVIALVALPWGALNAGTAADRTAQLVGWAIAQADRVAAPMEVRAAQAWTGVAAEDLRQLYAEYPRYSDEWIEMLADDMGNGTAALSACGEDGGALVDEFAGVLATEGVTETGQALFRQRMDGSLGTALGDIREDPDGLAFLTKHLCPAELTARYAAALRVTFRSMLDL